MMSFPAGACIWPACGAASAATCLSSVAGAGPFRLAGEPGRQGSPHTGPLLDTRQRSLKQMAEYNRARPAA